MPKANQKDTHLETTIKPQKYAVGNVINRWGKNFIITRIIKNKYDKDAWDVFGILFNKDS